MKSTISFVPEVGVKIVSMFYTPLQHGKLNLLLLFCLCFVDFCFVLFLGALFLFDCFEFCFQKVSFLFSYFQYHICKSPIFFSMLILC